MVTTLNQTCKWRQMTVEMSLWIICKKKYLCIVGIIYYDLHKNYRDTLLESDAVTDEEETLIQSFIDEDSETVPGSSTQYSSANDPYASITYTDLTDEIKLVTDLKCFTYIEQLVVLAGTKCRVSGCGKDITISYHTNCGYGVKLSWICTNQHRYVQTYAYEVIKH